MATATVCLGKHPPKVDVRTLRMARYLDTTTLPNGRYRLDVLASDTRWNLGTNSVTFSVVNSVSTPPVVYAPGIVTATRRPA